MQWYWFLPQKFKKNNGKIGLLTSFYKYIWQTAGDVLNNFCKLEYFLAARLLGCTIIFTSGTGGHEKVWMYHKRTKDTISLLKVTPYFMKYKHQKFGNLMCLLFTNHGKDVPQTYKCYKETFETRNSMIFLEEASKDTFGSKWR